MTDITPLKPMVGGRGLALQDVTITDAMLAPCVAAKSPEKAVKRLVGSLYDKANAATRKEARDRAKALTAKKKREQAIAKRAHWQRNKTTGVKARTPTRADRRYRMDFRYWLTSSIFVLFRVLLIGVTMGLIAMYVRASSYSTDLSSSWVMSLAFGFPVLVVSYVLACVADAFDNIDAQRRIALIYTALGALFLFGWLIAMASIFKFDTGAASQGFSMSLDPAIDPASADVPVILATLNTWFSVVFPQSVSGSLLLLLHVAGDVLIGAAAGVWAKLAFKTGREAEFVQRSDHAAYTAEYDAIEVRLRDIQPQLEYLAGIETGYVAGRVAAINTAVNRIPSLVLRMEADRLMAQSDNIEALIKKA